MRILVTFGSKRGGTEGIARMLGAVLSENGLAVEVAPPQGVRDLTPYDAVVIGGALYANRWPSDIRRFVKRNAQALRRMPVWMFSSGPLGENAAAEDKPPTLQVRRLMDKADAREHVTFGGRLTEDAKGFIASKMARSLAGDWRDPRRIHAWGESIARSLGVHPLPAARHAPISPEPAPSP